MPTFFPLEPPGITPAHLGSSMLDGEGESEACVRGDDSFGRERERDMTANARGLLKFHSPLVLNVNDGV